MKKLMTSDETCGDDVLLCPNCDAVWVHILKVEILTGNYRFEATTNGLKTDPRGSGEAIGNRGAIVKLYYACEICGCCGSIDFAFHKGMTYVHCVDLGENENWADLWRD